MMSAKGLLKHYHLPGGFCPDCVDEKEYRVVRKPPETPHIHYDDGYCSDCANLKRR